MKNLLILLALSAALHGQGTGPPGPQRSATNPVDKPCTVGSSAALLYNNAGVDTIYTAQGSPCVYAPNPSGSITTLTPEGIGVGGVATANKLSGPPNVLVATDGSGDGAAATIGAGLGFTSNTLSLQPPTLSAIGGVLAVNTVSHQWLAYIDTSGVPHLTQPNYSDLAGTNSALNASNINSGTLPSAQLPAINLAAAGAGGVTGSLPNAQVTNLGQIRAGSLPGSCVAGTDKSILFDSGGIDAGYYCDNTGHYALPPGGSTTVLAGATQGPGGSNTLNVTASTDVIGVTAGQLPTPYIYTPAVGTGVIGRPQTQKNQDVRSVMEFGAKGDCSTDDTSSIQAAVTFAQSAATSGQYGYKILFPYPPGGCYKLTAGIAISGFGFQLIGDTRIGTVIKQFTSNTPIFTIGASQDSHSITIAHFRATWNTQQTAGSNPNSVFIQSGSATPYETDIEDIYLSNGYRGFTTPSGNWFRSTFRHIWADETMTGGTFHFVSSIGGEGGIFEDILSKQTISEPQIFIQNCDCHFDNLDSQRGLDSVISLPGSSVSTIINTHIETHTFTTTGTIALDVSSGADGIDGLTYTGSTVGGLTNYVVGNAAGGGYFSVKNAVAQLEANGITAATIANPSIYTTVAAHGFTNGQSVFIAGFTAPWTGANGTCTVASATTNTFSCGFDSTSATAYPGKASAATSAWIGALIHANAAQYAYLDGYSLSGGIINYTATDPLITSNILAWDNGQIRTNNTLAINALGTATSSANFGSNILTLNASRWIGSASPLAMSLQLICVAGSSQNCTPTLSMSSASTSGLSGGLKLLSSNSFQYYTIASSITSDIFGFKIDNTGGTGGGVWSLEQGRTAAGQFSITQTATSRLSINSSGVVTIPVSLSTPVVNNSVNAVASSATPAFNLALGTYQTNTLTANVTSSTATGLSAGSQSYFKLTENSTGGFTYVWPTNIKGVGQINTAANAVNVVGTSCFDTSNCYATGPVMDQNGNGYFAGNVFSGGQQSAIGFSGAAVTLTPGTNITSVTCTSATCDVNGGSLSIVGGALASTGTFATVSYTAIATAPRVCMVAMNGGATFLGLGHGTPSTTSFTLTSAISVAATTFTMDYQCKP